MRNFDAQALVKGGRQSFAFHPLVVLSGFTAAFFRLAVWVLARRVA
ncbi:MAG: hypothetical protein JXA33_18220 [Anaerolineae bacterium]|nr:hypothetical protein [Anaerolineae bacterium]